MRVVSMLLVLGVVACGPPPSMPCNVGAAGSGGGSFGGGSFGGGSFGGGSGASPLAPLLGTTGQPMTVSLSHFRSFTCGQAVSADEVVTEVLDPFNRKVVHTHTAPVTGGDLATQVTFTPMLAGNYHLSARFEPGLGSSQTDLLVVIDRATSRAKTLSLGVQCTALDVTGSGLALCLTSGDKLRVYRDDKLLQTFDADDYAVAGTALWITRLGFVERRVDVGGAMPFGAPLSFDTLVADVGTLVAREDQAVLVTRATTIQLRVSSGAVVEDARTVTPERTEAIQPGANFDWLLGYRSSGAGMTGGTICSVPLGTTGMAERCQLALDGSTVLGVDSSGIWSRDGVTLRLEALGADGAIVTSGLALANVDKASSSRHYESGPVVRFGAGKGYVPLSTPDGIVLELYPVEPGFTLMPSTGATVRAQHSDGRQRLFTR